jgi:hypothetical protein
MFTKKIAKAINKIEKKLIYNTEKIELTGYEITSSSCLMYACKRGYKRVIKLLLNYIEPQHFIKVCKLGYYNIVELIIKHKNFDKKTYQKALDLTIHCCKSGLYYKILRLIIEKDITIKHRSPIINYLKNENYTNLTSDFVIDYMINNAMKYKIYDTVKNILIKYKNKISLITIERLLYKNAYEVIKNYNITYNYAKYLLSDQLNFLNIKNIEFLNRLYMTSSRDIKLLVIIIDTKEIIDIKSAEEFEIRYKRKLSKKMIIQKISINESLATKIVKWL